MLTGSLQDMCRQRVVVAIKVVPAGHLHHDKTPGIQPGAERIVCLIFAIQAEHFAASEALQLRKNRQSVATVAWIGYQTPTVVNAENMQKVFDDGNAKVSEVCTKTVAEACQKAGLQ